MRHTFCSRLALAGAPAKAIQELAGHADLATTQRYLHLPAAAKVEAMRLLDRGGRVEADPRDSEKVSENQQLSVGAPGTRTQNQRLKRPLLYQLS